jgi:hypothetical protein
MRLMRSASRSSIAFCRHVTEQHCYCCCCLLQAGVHFTHCMLAADVGSIPQAASNTAIDKPTRYGVLHITSAVCLLQPAS